MSFSMHKHLIICFQLYYSISELLGIHKPIFMYSGFIHSLFITENE